MEFQASLPDELWSPTAAANGKQTVADIAVNAEVQTQ